MSYNTVSSQNMVWDGSHWVPETQPGGSGGGGTSSNFGSAFPSAGTAAGFKDASGNMAGVELEADGSLPVTVVAGGTGGGPVTIADGADVTEGAIADAKVVGDNAGTLSAKLRGLNTIWADVWDSVLHRINVTVQNATLAVTQSGNWVLSAGSALIGKVSIDQTTPGTTNAVVVSSSALPSGASTSALQGTGNTSVASIDTKTPALGQALAAASVPIVLTAAQITTLTPPAAITGFLTEADFDTKTGSLTETAPATDTASSGLNGRLQRIAQRITSLITALGSPFQVGGSIGNTTFASTVADAANVTLGAKADAKSIATDTTPITAMSVLKQISASVQAPPSQAVTNAGTFAQQETGTQVQVDDAAFTPATSKIVMVGFTADETSTDSVDEGDGGAARMTLDRKQIVTVEPHSAGGTAVMNATSSDGATALTSTAQVIKASAGQVYGWYIYNPNATAQFVQFYNTAAGSVTVGTTNPLFMLTIPATSAANLMGAVGIEFTNAGFSWAATSTAGGNGAPGTALDAVVFYK